MITSAASNCRCADTNTAAIKNVWLVLKAIAYRIVIDVLILDIIVYELRKEYHNEQINGISDLRGAYEHQKNEDLSTGHRILSLNSDGHQDKQIDGISDYTSTFDSEENPFSSFTPQKLSSACNSEKYKQNDIISNHSWASGNVKNTDFVAGRIKDEQIAINQDNRDLNVEQEAGYVAPSLQTPAISRLGDASGGQLRIELSKMQSFWQFNKEYNKQRTNNVPKGCDAKPSRNCTDDSLFLSGKSMAPYLKEFTLAELKMATRNFKLEEKLGDEGFGKVFKGWVDSMTYAPSKAGIGMAVAVRYLCGFHIPKEVESEAKFFGEFNHPNLVKLLGYCFRGRNFYLVYEYMQNGSLESCLFRRNLTLPWDARIKIVAGVARVLAFLHTAEEHIIHRDIKASNILLDAEFNAKLSDFGLLPKLDPANGQSHVTMRVQGSYGYAAPNYLTAGRLTKKSDVYAFGVLLLEVLTGLRVIDRNRPPGKHNVEEVVHACNGGHNNKQIDRTSNGGGIYNNQQDGDLRTGHEGANGNVACHEEDTNGAYNNQQSRDFLTEQEEIGGNVGHHDKRINGNSDTDHANTIQEHADSSAERVAANTVDGGHDLQTDGTIRLGDASGKQSRKKPAMKTLTKFFSDRAGMISGAGAKQSRLKKSYSNNGGVGALSGKIVTPNLKLFTFNDLSRATRNFTLRSGGGDFEMVFKGWVDKKTFAPSTVGVGMAVAVKKLNLYGPQGTKEAQLEVKFLGKFCHPNLVKLLGYCSEDGEFLLVHEYMEGGSLERHLFIQDAEPLALVTRLKIAIDAARALAFLHAIKKQVIYRGFKASDVLLDGDSNAKLSDFGPAKFRPTNGESHISSLLVGDTSYTNIPKKNIGYIAPEYVTTGHLNMKSDVYGFGVVLLEMLTGLRVLDFTRSNGIGCDLVDWATPLLTDRKRLKEVIDPRMEYDYSRERPVLVAMGDLVLKCVAYYPKNRPWMQEVLETLVQIKEQNEKGFLNSI
ncbi:hypothetical protein RJ639_035365 [Escallonia herrerae]|uniref:non-specific serine/threonine protein kinase n=1 Tax=Escallonia herrerae TaxID=1293975 RepID=A0AA88WUG1_9ASTE|nr:hypothetical protein RJ639_035365 [Escallonia herrerae]